MVGSGVDAGFIVTLYCCATQSLTVSGLLGGLGGEGPGAIAARDSMTTGGFSLLTFLSSEGTLLRWKAQVCYWCQ